MNEKNNFRLFDPILPGNQDYTGNGDKFSIDWWENGLLDQNEKIFSEELNTKMREQTQGPEMAAVADDEFLVEKQVAIPRTPSKMRVFSYGGNVNNKSITEVPLPRDAKLLKIMAYPAPFPGPLYILDSNLTLNTYNLMSDSIAKGLRSIGANQELLFPVRSQQQSIFLTTQSGVMVVTVVILAGDFDIDEYLMNH